VETANRVDLDIVGRSKFRVLIVGGGWNVVGRDIEHLIKWAVKRHAWPQDRPSLFGDGHAGQAIVRILKGKIR
jgi:hypothetical protein